MFKRFHDWVRGSKKTVSVDTASSDKKKTKFKGRPRSKTEGAIPSSGRPGESFDDEFRRNDIEAFDIVLAPESETEPRNGRLSGEGTQHTATAQSTSTDQMAMSKSVHEPDPPTKDSDSESIVDLVSPQQNQKMDAPEEANLSLDEMQTLELLDSIVQDLETSQCYDDSSETIELGKNETKTGDTGSTKDAIEFQKPVTVVDTKNQSIDYNQVLGETHEEQPDSDVRPDNWEITGFTAKQKPFRFVSKEMYLPSPEPQHRAIEPIGAPELPPTDYPETDDDDKDVDNVECEEMHDALQSRSFSVPIVTSFSVKPTPIQRTTSYDAHGDVESAGNTSVLSRMAENPKWSLTNGSMPNLAINGLDTGSTRSTNTACSAEGHTSVTAKGQSETPKRPKPRVTSFKSCTLPPRITIKPVTEMVKRFENDRTGETF